MREADVVVTGARVRAGGSSTDAVAVRAGRIVALGADDVEAVRGPRTRVIDVPGGLAIPGFQDAHVHPTLGGRQLLTVNLHGLDGPAAYLDAVAAYAGTHEQEWIVGGGWAMEHFPGGTPRREDLDVVVPDRPVFLFNRDLHGAWVNSAALRRAGIDAGTPDPSDGRIERDPVTGEPAGTLHEGAAYSFEAVWVPPPDRAMWEAALLKGQAHLHSLGVTGWQDAWVSPDTQAAYLSLGQAGRLSARVVGALWWDRHRGLEQIPELVARREQAAPNFHPTTVKIMVDGVLENRTGALLEPYCGCGEEKGLTYVERELLRAALVELDAAGFDVHLHAIGDRAVRDGLDAVAAARAANASQGRHHIAHLQVVAPDDVPRFGQLGVAANCQAYWAQSEPQMDDMAIPLLGPDRAAQQYPFGDLQRSGAVLAMGSDWPVTTADPLRQIEVAVRRVDPDRRSVAPFLPGQVLDLATAVDAFTAGSAWVNRDGDAGVLALGRRADLAVLDRDLFAGGFPADARVTHTLAAGAVVYESP